MFVQQLHLLLTGQLILYQIQQTLIAVIQTKGRCLTQVKSVPKYLLLPLGNKRHVPQLFGITHDDGPFGPLQYR